MREGASVLQGEEWMRGKLVANEERRGEERIIGILIWLDKLTRRQ